MRRYAMNQVNQAVKLGILKRAQSCEVCDFSPEEYQRAHIQWSGGEAERFVCPQQTAIVGHHWRGYDHPLDVWWVCRSCNRRLAGRHDGSLTLKDAREFVQKQGGNWRTDVARQGVLNLIKPKPRKAAK